MGGVVIRFCLLLPVLVCTFSVVCLLACLLCDVWCLCFDCRVNLVFVCYCSLSCLRCWALLFGLTILFGCCICVCYCDFVILVLFDCASVGWLF